MTRQPGSARPITMGKRIDYLQRAAHAWLAFKRVVDSVSDAELERRATVGAWAGRDVLAHIAVWENEALEVIRRVDAGEPEIWPELHGAALDDWNESHVAPFRAWTVAQVREFADATHAELMQLAERSPAAGPQIAAEMTEGHCAEHLDDMRGLALRPPR